MTRSVKDLRELICVSRLSIRDSDEDDDYDLSRPLSSLSIYGERSVGLINGNGDYQQRADIQRGQGAKDGGFAVPRPPSSARGGSRLKSGERPRSAQSRSLSDHSSFNFRKDSSPLPPVGGGGSRPSSNSSSGSDRPGSGETARSNFDHILQYLTDVAVTEWLERTTQMLNELTVWCNNLDHFVDFAQFWLTEFTENQRLDIYKLEIGIVADELIAAFGNAYVQGKVQPSDVSSIVSGVIKEYPNKLCSAQGGHVFLDILDTITSQKTQAYRRLLTDTRISTRNSTYAQSLLALRAFALLSIWNSIIHFYKRVTQQATGAEGGEIVPEKKSAGNGELIAQQRLFRAVQKGYVSVIYYFLRNGRVKLDVRDDQGRTLTFASVLANQSSVLHYLITKHKAALPVNQAGESGNTPLHTAATWNYVDCIEVLITKGNADVNIANKECDNATPLHVAVMQGHLEATKMLVSAGANVTASMNGITPLQLATDMGHQEIRELLLTKSGLGDYHDEAMDVADGVDGS